MTAPRLNSGVNTQVFVGGVRQIAIEIACDRAAVSITGVQKRGLASQRKGNHVLFAEAGRTTVRLTIDVAPLPAGQLSCLECRSSGHADSGADAQAAVRLFGTPFYRYWGSEGTET
jgi:hypothetical protein